MIILYERKAYFQFKRKEIHMLQDPRGNKHTPICPMSMGQENLVANVGQKSTCHLSQRNGTMSGKHKVTWK